MDTAIIRDATQDWAESPQPLTDAELDRVVGGKWIDDDDDWDGGWGRGGWGRGGWGWGGWGWGGGTSVGIYF